MPNHITNILKAPACVLSALHGENGLVDFNSMFPMPVTLRDVTVNGDENLVELLNGKLNLSPDREDFLSSLTLSNVIRDIKNGGIEKWDDKRFENFITMLRGQRDHGATSWYSFSCQKWGTKWNAYDILEIKGGVQFETAWSAPHPVIQKLADQFPNEVIEHSWADEDTGSNLGHRTYQHGSSNDAVIDDPIDFALTITGRDREYYRKNPESGKWEYFDADDEGPELPGISQEVGA